MEIKTQQVIHLTPEDRKALSHVSSLLEELSQVDNEYLVDCSIGRLTVLMK